MLQFFSLLTLALSAYLSFLVIPRVVFVSVKRRLFDVPNSRSSHTRAVPRLGGIIFLPCMMFSYAFILGIRELNGVGVVTELRETLLLEMLFLICGLILIYGIGVLDDLRGVSFRKKFVAQIIASVLLIFGDIHIDNLHGIFGIYELPTFMSYLLTVFIIVLIINSINLIDGIDGLASGLSSVALSVYGFWFLSSGLYAYAMLAFSLLGTVVVFFLYNVFGRRMKLFMGDTGSLILGYCLAFLAIRFCQFNATPEFGVVGAPIVAFSTLFIPIFDVFRVFIVRVRHGKSPFLPDKNHIHHKLLALGMSHRQAMLTLLIASSMFILINWLLVKSLGETAMFLADIFLGLCLVYGLQHFIVDKERKLVKRVR
ncbi:MraY family glycosyltransferase [Coprobacter sp.]